LRIHRFHTRSNPWSLRKTQGESHRPSWPTCRNHRWRPPTPTGGSRLKECWCPVECEERKRRQCQIQDSPSTQGQRQPQRRPHSSHRHDLISVRTQEIQRGRIVPVPVSYQQDHRRERVQGHDTGNPHEGQASVRCAGRSVTQREYHCRHRERAQGKEEHLRSRRSASPVAPVRPYAPNPESVQRVLGGSLETVDNHFAQMHGGSLGEWTMCTQVNTVTGVACRFGQTTTASFAVTPRHDSNVTRRDERADRD